MSKITKQQQLSNELKSQYRPAQRQNQGELYSNLNLPSGKKIGEKTNGIRTALPLVSRQNRMHELGEIYGNVHLQRLISSQVTVALVQKLDQQLPYIGPVIQYVSPTAWAMRLFGRRLTSTERKILEPVFGNAINYFMIRIKIGGIASSDGTPRTVGNIINASHEPIDSSTLIHECAHIWQFQNGIGFGYAISALRSQGLAWLFTGNRNRAYNYSLLEKYHIPWRYWNAEQQAKWIEDNRRLPSNWWLTAILPPKLRELTEFDVPFI
jgi:hypothetical protein